jgi:hypothetical protein
MSELLKINVNEHTERKGQLTYLSWAWAWAEVLKVDPAAHWRLGRLGPDDSPAFFMPDGSAMVSVHVTIKGNDQMAVLPVMDNRNKAIKNPDAFAINTAIMRCLAKAIAMHGLGLYIYAGEDLPEGEEPPQAEQPRPVGIHAPARLAFESLQPEQQDRMRRLSQAVLKASGPSQMIDVIDAADLDQDEKAGLWSLLDSKTRSAIKQAQKEAA